MTTQNISLYRSATLLNVASGTYYFPDANGTDGDGFDHIEVAAMLASKVATDTLALYVEADDGTTGTFGWDETRGCYYWGAGTYGNTFTAINLTTVYIRLTMLAHNAKKWRVRVVVDAKAAPDNTITVGIRKVKV